jgi:hypothetical protein
MAAFEFQNAQDLSDSAGQDFDLDLDKHEENGQKVPAALLQIGFRLTT